MILKFSATAATQNGLKPAESVTLRSADSSHLSSQLSQLDHHQTEPFSYPACWSSARWGEMRRRMVWRLLCTSREGELSSPKLPWKASNEGWSIYEPWDFAVCIRAAHQLPVIAPDNDQERKQFVFLLFENIFKKSFRIEMKSKHLGVKGKENYLWVTNPVQLVDYLLFWSFLSFVV